MNKDINNPHKKDFSTRCSDVRPSFDDIGEWQYVFLVGFKDGECFMDEITSDVTGRKMINNKFVELFSAKEQKEYYDGVFDFYFIFDEEDERQEFIDENKLEFRCTTTNDTEKLNALRSELHELRSDYKSKLEHCRALQDEHRKTNNGSVMAQVKTGRIAGKCEEYEVIISKLKTIINSDG